MKKLVNWLSLLLSDSNQVSSRRFIAIQSFYLIVATLLIAFSFGTKQFGNIELIKQIELHLFYLTLAGIFGVTATNITSILKSQGQSNGFGPFGGDVFKGTQDDIDTPENP